MMARGLTFGVLLLGLLGILAGCAETELAVHNAKRLQTPEPAPSQPGNYKVGRPYQIANVWYYPREDYGYDETGIASWYGPGFHGKSTANGEVYDQNAMTAAHRTLPMPSVVQVTNLENGRSVKVRINDRGPFAHGRIIDMSKRAAELLGFVKQGTAKVRVQILEIESRQAALEAGAGEAVAGTAPKAAPVESVSVQELPPIGVSAPEPAAGASGATETAAAPAASQTAAVSEPAHLRTATTTMPEPVVTQERVRPTSIFVQAGAFSQVANAVRLRARLSSLGNVQIAKALVGDASFYRVRLGPMANVDQADRTLALLLRNGYNDARVVVD
ncbi:septal ring lytic transglycosylase RlpA family protein [Pelagibius sp. CAU 1746]|uniref:septal ring lytic transglycosylase RlpA family protein n=1 Tax=Pelagibius sp. CAU 1746 TaxID=3140370 RepID=UPI00325B5874